MTKGTWQRGSGEAFRANYPFPERRRGPAPMAATDPRDAEIARLKADLAAAHERINNLNAINAMQSRTLALKNRVWTEDERERYRVERAAKTAQRARDDAEGRS